MDKIRKFIFAKEPLVILGFIATVAVAIYDEARDNDVSNWKTLLPIVVAVLGRFLVTPAAAVRAKKAEKDL